MSQYCASQAHTLVAMCCMCEGHEGLRGLLRGVTSTLLSVLGSVYLVIVCYMLYLLTGSLCADDLHQFRLLQRRFIVYRSSKAASSRCHGSTADSPPPSMRSAHSQLAADSRQAGEDVPATTPDSAAAGECKRSLHNYTQSFVATAGASCCQITGHTGPC